jgi:hypothetical protein
MEWPCLDRKDRSSATSWVDRQAARPLRAPRPQSPGPQGRIERGPDCPPSHSRRGRQGACNLEGSASTTRPEAPGREQHVEHHLAFGDEAALPAGKNAPGDIEIGWDAWTLRVVDASEVHADEIVSGTGGDRSWSSPGATHAMRHLRQVAFTENAVQHTEEFAHRLGFAGVIDRLALAAGLDKIERSQLGQML